MTMRWFGRLVAAGLVLTLLACDTTPGASGTPPAAPTNVAAAGAAGFVDVGWAHDGVNAQAFRVYRDEAVDASVVVATTPLADLDASERSFRDWSAQPGVPYRYAVAARGANGLASQATAHTGAPAIAGEAAPLELFAYVGTYAGWRPTPVIDLVTVVRGSAVGAHSSAFWTVTGPDPWGVYEFEAGPATSRIVVRDAVSGTYEVAVNIDGTRLTRTITVDADRVLPSPTGETLVRSAVDAVEVAWQPVPGAASYEVQFNEEGTNVYYTDRSTTASADFARFDLDLNPSAEHNLRVIAHSLYLTPDLFGPDPLPPSQQRDVVLGDLVCFYPGDAAFRDCT